MPTGVAIRDVRKQLFDAAERVLLRDGPNSADQPGGDERGRLAKGVLHRHFADFDGFLTELVLDRTARVGDLGATLRAAAGAGTVTENLAEALTSLFGSVALEIVALTIFRDDLRARLREATPEGVPVLTEATDMVASYLAIERELGRIAADADVENIAPTLIGSGHLLFAGRKGASPETEAVRKLVTTVVGGVVQPPSP